MDIKKYIYCVGIKSLLCLSIFYLLSCSESKDNFFTGHELVNIKIDLEHDTEPLKLSQYTIDSVCSLTFPDTTKIVAVTHFMVKNKRIYVMYTEISQSVYVFDAQGRYLQQLGERGRAQDEYIGGPTNFFVDDSNNVHVFDQMGQQIKVFNTKGHFKRNVATGHEFPHSIGLLNNKRYSSSITSTNPQSPSLMSIDLNGANSKILIPSKPYYRYQHSNITFFSNGNRLSHIPILSDSVLVFKGDSLEKIVHFDFDGKFLPYEEPEIPITSDIEKFRKIKQYKGVWSLDQYQETDSNALLLYIHHSNVKNWLYNKRTHKVIQGNQLFDGVIPFRSVYYLRGNQIIALVEQENVDIYKDLYENMNDGFKENLAKTPSQVRDVLEGRIKTPALFYITVK